MSGNINSLFVTLLVLSLQSGAVAKSRIWTEIQGNTVTASLTDYVTVEEITSFEIDDLTNGNLDSVSRVSSSSTMNATQPTMEQHVPLSTTVLNELPTRTLVGFGEDKAISTTFSWSLTMNEIQPTIEQYNATTGPIRTLEGFVEENVISTTFSWLPINWSWVLILQLISAIIGIVGNLLVVIVLFHRRRKSRSTDTLIGGLACADFITSVFLLPSPQASYVPKTLAGEMYCRIVMTQSLLWASVTASTYLLMSISVERYIAVVYPLHFKHLITRRRIYISIGVLWVISVLSGLFSFIVNTVDEFANKCTDQWSRQARIIFAYYWFCLRLVLPCLTMLVSQILIARKLSHQANHFRGITNTANRHGKPVPSFHIVARNRVLKMMLIVILIYIVCWTPNQVAYLGYNLGWVPQSYLNSTLQRMLTVLGFYNSCANPVIYTARYPEFREALRDMLTCNAAKNAPLFEKGDIAEKSALKLQSLGDQI